MTDNFEFDESELYDIDTRRDSDADELSDAVFDRDPIVVAQDESTHVNILTTAIDAGQALR
jgi:hypothetical protein